jgi:probable rRNA maturation factor
MDDPGDSRTPAVTGSCRPLWLRLDVVHDAGDWSLFEPAADLVTEAGAALAGQDSFATAGPATACVALSDDATVRKLNARYRGQDVSTNVLSFPSAPHRGVPSDARSLGDLVLAQETVVREAAEQGIQPAHHFQHLVVHGLLHLLGFDHRTDEEAEEMEGLETAILSRLGIPDPYSHHAAEDAAVQRRRVAGSRSCRHR